MTTHVGLGHGRFWVAGASVELAGDENALAGVVLEPTPDVRGIGEMDVQESTTLLDDMPDGTVVITFANRRSLEVLRRALDSIAANANLPP